MTSENVFFLSSLDTYTELVDVSSFFFSTPDCKTTMNNRYQILYPPLKKKNGTIVHVFVNIVLVDW